MKRNEKITSAAGTLIEMEKRNGTESQKLFYFQLTIVHPFSIDICALALASGKGSIYAAIVCEIQSLNHWIESYFIRLR